MSKCYDFFKKNISRNKIILLVIVILFALQLYFICSSTYAKYILNYNLKSTYNHSNNVLLSYSLEPIVWSMEGQNNNIIIIYDNSDNTFGTSLDLIYLYNRNLFYPNQIANIGNITTTSYEQINSDYLISSIEIYNINYVILIGKNVSLLGENTTKDITLLSTDNIDNIKIDKEYNYLDNSVFNQYVISNHSDKLHYYVKLMKNNALNYWDPLSYTYLESYANYLLDNEQYSEAIEYYSYCLIYDGYDTVALLNRGIAYYNLNDYSLAKNDFSTCLTLGKCDNKVANSYNRLIESKEGL